MYAVLLKYSTAAQSNQPIGEETFPPSFEACYASLTRTYEARPLKKVVDAPAKLWQNETKEGEDGGRGNDNRPGAAHYG